MTNPVHSGSLAADNTAQEHKTILQKRSLKIASWNINGSGGHKQWKLKDKKFIQEVKKFDIIALSETHCARTNFICLPGYFTQQSHIEYPGKKAIGGIALLVKNDIKSAVNIVKDADDYIWFRLEKTFFGLDRDVFACAAYIPPEKSKYLNMRGNPDILDQITKDIAAYSEQGHIMLMGDLNARTANQKDYVSYDSDNLSDYCVLPNMNHIDAQLGQRCSQDNVLDCRGKQLIDVCIQSRIRILNGRSLGDTCGYFTCHKSNGSSVVDYCMVNEEFFNRVLCFKVHPLLDNLSDHCLISTLIKTDFYLQQIEPHGNMTGKSYEAYLWKDGDIVHFQNELTKPASRENINNLLYTDYNEVNTAVADLRKILTDAADRALATKKPTNNKHIKNKPWFDKPLQTMRKELGSKARLLCRFPNDPHVRGAYYKLLKKYNKTRKYKQRLHKQEIFDRLEMMNSNNKPKEFWKTLTDLRLDDQQDNPATNISLFEWYEYFKDLNHGQSSQHEYLNEHCQQLLAQLPNTNLNEPIQEKEIIRAISKLKNNKAQGPDKIRNEMIKYSQHAILPCLAKVFNIILKLGRFPDEWAEGYICPLYKTGNPLIKDNYRGITITSCLGKVFNSIINARLDSYISKNEIIPDVQIAYKDKSRTSDHMFVLKTLIDKTLKKDKKQLFACFVDFKKAFDSVSHDALMYKLASVGIGGNVHTLIRNLYEKSKLSVKLGNFVSNPFPSNIGVRQGDNLSPNLFKLFIHDLPNVCDTECNPPTLISKEIGCLLFADDAILLSTTKCGLQRAINNLQNYCDKWGLTVNPKKTKSMVFNSRGKNQSIPLLYKGEPLECVQEYKYLGTLFNNNGSFTKSCENLYQRGLKAFFKLRRQLAKSTVKPSTYSYLFDVMVKPVLLYSSEIWAPCVAQMRRLNASCNHNIEQAYENVQIEKLNSLLMRYILGVNSKTTKMALYSETGRFPLYIEAVKNACKYLNRIEEGDCSAMLTEALTCNKSLNDSWYCNLKKIISNVTLEDNIDNNVPIHNIVRELKNRFTNYWRTKAFGISNKQANNSKKLRCYETFKQCISVEKYLDTISNAEARRAMAKFRTSSHNLRIETGRYEKICVQDRLCNMCACQEVEDEVHFLITCPAYEDSRKSLFTLATRECTGFNDLSSEMKFIWLMSTEQTEVIRAMANFLNVNFKLRNTNMGIK
jgi:exonuclease III